MFISPIRTIVIRRQQASYGVSPASPVLFWPVAEPEDDLDYGLDIGAWLNDIQDAVSEVSVSAAPSGAGELVLSGLQLSGSLIGLMMAGGVAGRPYYTVRFEVATTGGRSKTWRIGLQIDSTAGPSPPPAPPSFGFGPAITWPVSPYSPSFDLTNPLNSGYFALLAGF
jgi:hypothetical protein